MWLALLAPVGASGAEWAVYSQNPFVIQLDQDPPDNSAGGIAVGDVTGDGRLDYLFTTDRSIGAYDHDGRKLWVINDTLRPGGSAEGVGLPGHNHPRVEVHDVDGDGSAEVLYLRAGGDLVILDGRTGKRKRTHRPQHPKGVAGWEAFTVCNLRGLGDRDIILQTTNAKGYRVGRYVAAFALDKLDGPPLWKTDHFGGLAHGPLRVGDLDGDGRDEVCGYTILGPDGKPTAWRYPPIDKKYGGGASFHIDSIFLYDVRPDVPGLEVVLLEEGRNYVGIVNLAHGLLSWTTNRRQEPQNAAVGEFDPNRPGLEIWCRSRYNHHQIPWVLDAHGKIIATWKMDDVAPKGWTVSGVEHIYTIDWTGERKQLACATERHTNGDVCLFEPMTGKFVKVFPEKAARLFVADVAGDWREEIIVQTGKTLRIHFNEAPNPRPGQPRLWTQNAYRRSKANYNYYSP